MSIALPSLSTYDPAANSEGTLDPLGLYQIADQLGTKLVPAVRERMQRIRFLTAMSIGSLVCEGLEADPEQPEVSPFLVWEWLVVESFIREADENLKGVPGTQVTRRALADHGYLDARSYLKTPRIFGFHGVYKRLAVHLGLLDVDLGPRPEGEQLAEAWAADLAASGGGDWRALRPKWSAAVRRGLTARPFARTRPDWSKTEWQQLAHLLLPDKARRRERKRLRELLHSENERSLNALPAIWRQQTEIPAEQYCEETLHKRLHETLPSARTLLEAIQAYEKFCRSLEDAFDLLRAIAGEQDARGFEIASLGDERDFIVAVMQLDQQCERARHCLGDLDLQIAGTFDERFSKFAEPMSAGELAELLCTHHEEIQKGKSAEGKRAWFDRLGDDRIYMRRRYCEARRANKPGAYVHAYRGGPIRTFYNDLHG